MHRGDIATNYLLCTVRLRLPTDPADTRLALPVRTSSGERDGLLAVDSR